MENERYEESKLREAIESQIKHNDKAQSSMLTVQEVVDMEPENRKRWFRDTADGRKRQRRIHEYTLPGTNGAVHSNVGIPTLTHIVKKARTNATADETITRITVQRTPNFKPQVRQHLTTVLVK